MNTEMFKKKISKIKLGLHCIIHVHSPIVEGYFNEYGQPIKRENMHKACFEGKVVPLPRDFVSLNKSKQTWAIKIPALSKTDRPFYADASQIDQYFCEEFVGPDDWETLDKAEMEELYRIYESQHAWSNDLNTPVSSIRGSKTTEVNKSSNEDDDFVDDTRYFSKTRLDAKMEQIESTMALIRAYTTQESIDLLKKSNNLYGTAEDATMDATMDVTKEEEPDEIDATMFEKDAIDDTMLERDAIDPCNLVHITDHIDENDQWETLNRTFENNYGRGKNLTSAPTEEDMDTVVKFISSIKNSDLQYLAEIWLNKFHDFIDNNSSVKKSSSVKQSSTNISTSDRVLRSSPNVAVTKISRIVRPINLPTSTSAVLNIETQDFGSTPVMQPNKPRSGFDMSFLPDSMTEIPDIRENAEKFNTVQVNYNELERFFQVADKKTKFENLFDLVCISAVNTLNTVLKM